MSIAGLDIGSSGAKVTVLDERGALLHTGYRDYPVSRRAGAHEVDANTIWDTARALLREAAAEVPELGAIGITSFGESFVLLDEHDSVLAPAMLYTDPRGEAESAQLADALGAEQIADSCGTLPHPMFSLPKLMWTRRHRPELFSQVRRVLLMADFVVYRLTGRQLMDYALAARTMGLDIRRLDWHHELFAAAGISPALFGEPVPSGTLAGTLRPALAAELRLSPDTRVVLCGHDQIAAAVGSGVLSPGMAANGAGTVECVTPVFAGIPEGAALQKRNYAVIPFLGNENYCCYAFSFAGGSLVKWFMQATNQSGGDVYGRLESAVPDAPSGLLLLPHFAGAATPYMDTAARGAIVGLQLSHGTADLYRAVQEGIAFEMALNVETLRDTGVTVTALNASGGCARSDRWLQMKADILGLPVTRLTHSEAGTVGSVMMTAVAAGLYADLNEAAAALVRPAQTFHPRKDMYESYRPHFARYQRLYDALRPLREEQP